MAYNNTGEYVLIPADDIALLPVTCIQIAAITRVICIYRFERGGGAASLRRPLTDIINFSRSVAWINLPLGRGGIDRCFRRPVFSNQWPRLNQRGSNLNVFSTTNDIIICSD
ncbi:hypothetical protein BDFB_006977 [Asbolus verrucosus]|uniref:Uncharacterized protein n=1 Tax=Asbolus verrucosus TaxID=1661398 RepID=A0A482WAZ3_ASBVE|nr:hypothetical protein BDFB_006977 [Asbolus verrucosus]